MLSVSECFSKKFIQIKAIPPGQAVKIYRRAQNEFNFKHIGDTNPTDGVLDDRDIQPKSRQVYSYRFQLPNGKWSQAYTCLTSSAGAIVPYQPLYRTLQNIDFQWSALQGVQKYHLQVSRMEQTVSLVNGFAPENVLLDTILATNQYKWQSNAKLGDTLYWSVKPVLESNVNETFFLKPILIVMDPNRGFAGGNAALNFTNFSIKQNNVTITVANSTKNVLNEVKLHYFVSDTPAFTLQARLLTTQFVERIAPAQSKTIQQPLPLKGLKGYLLIVPSVNGTFLEQQAISQPIR